MPWLLKSLIFNQDYLIGKEIGRTPSVSSAQFFLTNWDSIKFEIDCEIYADLWHTA